MYGTSCHMGVHALFHHAWRNLAVMMPWSRPRRRQRGTGRYTAGVAAAPDSAGAGRAPSWTRIA